MDLAEGHMATLSYIEELCRKDQHGFDAINLGTGTGYSVLEMIAAMEKVMMMLKTRMMIMMNMSMSMITISI